MFGAEKDFFVGPSRDKGWLVIQSSKLPDSFGGKVFIGKIWDEGCRVCDFFSDWLVITGQCSRNLALRVQ